MVVSQGRCEDITATFRQVGNMEIKTDKVDTDSVVWMVPFARPSPPGTCFFHSKIQIKLKIWPYLIMELATSNLLHYHIHQELENLNLQQW